jgi:capsular polysaccharide biosynthesis protein
VSSPGFDLTKARRIPSEIAKTVTVVQGLSPEVASYLQRVEWYPKLIAATCSFFDSCVYVEIGVSWGFSLEHIAPACGEVHGVDVVAPSKVPSAVKFWHMPSDQFFDVYDGSAPNVIFIDGDHSYEQAARDFANSLALLDHGGIIFLHDTWPRGQDDTVPERCGTVWQLAEEIRSRPGLESFSWPGFPGLTIVRREAEGRDSSVLRSAHAPDVTELAPNSFTAARGTLANPRRRKLAKRDGIDRRRTGELLLTPALEAEVLPLCRSVTELLSPQTTQGRVELLPGSSRSVSDWYPAAMPMAGGTPPQWWSTNPTVTSNPLFLYRVRDVYYMPRFGALISPTGTVFSASAAQALYYTPDMSRLPGVSFRDGSAYLTPNLRMPRVEHAIVTFPWGAANNYGHFLLDCLPGLAQILEIPNLEGYTRVFPILHPWQRRHLDLLGVDDRDELSEDLYQIRDAVFCSSMQTNLQAPNINYRTLRERQLSRVEIPDSTPVRLYLARESSPRRNFLTEVQLRKEMKALGCDVVFPERYSVDEQIALFHRAEIVVGCAGAAFANVLYCREGAVIVEIIPSRMATQRLVSGVWVSNICALIGCQWRPYVCSNSWPTEEPEPGLEERPELNTTFEVDIDDFLRYFSDAIS